MSAIFFGIDMNSFKIKTIEELPFQSWRLEVIRYIESILQLVERYYRNQVSYHSFSADTLFDDLIFNCEIPITREEPLPLATSEYICRHASQYDFDFKEYLDKDYQQYPYALIERKGPMYLEYWGEGRGECMVDDDTEIYDLVRTEDEAVHQCAVLTAKHNRDVINDWTERVFIENEEFLNNLLQQLENF